MGTIVKFLVASLCLALGSACSSDTPDTLGEKSSSPLKSLASIVAKEPETPKEVALAFIDEIYKHQDFDAAMSYLCPHFRMALTEMQAMDPKTVVPIEKTAAYLEDKAGLEWTVTKEKVRPSDEIIDGLPEGGYAKITVKFHPKTKVMIRDTPIFEAVDDRQKKMVKETAVQDWETIYKLKQEGGKWRLHNIESSGMLRF